MCFSLAAWNFSVDHLATENTVLVQVVRKGKSHMFPFLFPFDTVKHSNLSIIHSNTGLFLELSFSNKSSGVHDKLHISSTDWWDLLLPLA